MIRAKDENSNSLTLEELKDQVLLLLFAGHETLTSAIASFCLLTAQHPDVREKLREEQARLSPTSPLSLEDIKQMTYLEQVIKEVMRVISPVGGGFRKAIKSFEFNGYQIPEGWTLQYQIAQTHQDDSIYTDSDRFDPDRFSPERAEDQKTSFGYIRRWFKRMYWSRICPSGDADFCSQITPKLSVEFVARSKFRFGYCAVSSS